MSNTPPIIANPLSDLMLGANLAFIHTLPGNAFVGHDSQALLTYTAHLSNGYPLPHWLTFEAATRSFSGMPQQDTTLEITVIASDGNLTVNDTFNLTTAANRVPTFSTISNGSGKQVVDISGNDTGRTVLRQPDGKLVIAGDNYNDFSLVRLNADGSLDTSFDGDGKALIDLSGYSDVPHSLLIQPDGKLILVGLSDRISEQFVSLVRLNTDGTLDTTFGDFGKKVMQLNGENTRSALTQPDGKLLLAGAGLSDSSWDFSLLRLNADGSLDTSFNADGKVLIDFSGGHEQVTDIKVQPDGKLVLAGWSRSGSKSEFCIVRLNADGSLDPSFDTDGKKVIAVGSGDSEVNSILIQPDGKLVLAGWSGTGTNSDFSLVRLNADGALDTLFNGDGKVVIDFGGRNSQAQSVIIQPDGKLVMVGHSYGDSYDFSLVRLNANGSRDTMFGDNGTKVIAVGSRHDTAYSALIQPDGKLVLAGKSDYDFALVRLNTDGSFDTSFNGSAENRLAGIVEYIENAAAIPLDADVQIYDADLAASDNYAGSRITLTRNDGTNAQDVFGARGNLVFTGVNVMLSGVNIGSVTNSNGTLSMTFNSAATQARVNEALSSISYANTSDNPSASVQIDWIFNDGSNTNNASVTGSTSVNITAVNDAPTIVTPLADQQVSAQQIFTYTLPGNTFVDADYSGLLAYTAMLVNGTALPNWLSFNPSTRSFSGTPQNSNVGMLDIKVIASDGSLIGSDEFRLQVSAISEPIPAPISIPIGSFGGVIVTETTFADGSKLITIPVIPADRPGGVANAYVNIPLLKNVTGESILAVGLPTGFGLNIIGQPLTQTSSAASQQITTTLGNLSALDPLTREQIVVELKGFLAGLSTDARLLVQTITPTIAGGAAVPTLPLVIKGSSRSEDGQQALVIDVSQLPAGIILQVDDIEFLTIIGQVRALGGAGQNTAVGDGQQQFMVLGADDDLIHGGAGDDIVGSLGGNDQIFGDEGNDIVYGGAGDDLLTGGKGNDRLNGGLGKDTAKMDGARSDYTITTEDNTVVLTHKLGEVERLIDVELIKFANGNDLQVSYGETHTTEYNPDHLKVIATTNYSGNASNESGYLPMGLGFTIDGQGGHDVLKMQGKASDYHLGKNGNALEITRYSDGAMFSLQNAETIAFDSKEVMILARDRAEGILARMVQVYLDRDATAAEWQEGTQAVANYYANPASAANVFAWFHQQAPGLSQLSNSAYVQTLFQNGLGRQANATELANYVQKLDNNTLDRDWLAVEMASSAEAVSTIGTVMVFEGWM